MGWFNGLWRAAAADRVHRAMGRHEQSARKVERGLKTTQIVMNSRIDSVQKELVEHKAEYRRAMQNAGRNMHILEDRINALENLADDAPFANLEEVPVAPVIAAAREPGQPYFNLDDELCVDDGDGERVLRTKKGTVFTRGMIDALQAEAEEGYDIDPPGAPSDDLVYKRDDLPRGFLDQIEWLLDHPMATSGWVPLHGVVKNRIRLIREATSTQSIWNQVDLVTDLRGALATAIELLQDAEAPEEEDDWIAGVNELIETWEG